MVRRVASRIGCSVARSLARAAEHLELFTVSTFGAPERVDTFNEELAEELADEAFAPVAPVAPLSTEAASMVATNERPEPPPDAPLAGSLEARLAEARRW